MSAARIVILSLHGSGSPEEQRLARNTNLPVIDGDELEASDSDYYLSIESDGLTLYANTAGARTGLLVDFASPSLNRRAGDAFLKQNLAKAAGLKRGKRPSILDAMAGLGRDAYLLARAGCEVTLVERDKVVHALLADGIRRAVAEGGMVAESVARMTLLAGDFASLADELPCFDVVYLDPMFPSDRKSARSKKEMYFLQQLLGEAEESDALLDKALARALDRVVIKRGRLSPHYAGRESDISFKGSSSRFDVYLKR